MPKYLCNSFSRKIKIVGLGIMLKVTQITICIYLIILPHYQNMSYLYTWRIEETSQKQQTAKGMEKGEIYWKATWATKRIDPCK